MKRSALALIGVMVIATIGLECISLGLRWGIDRRGQSMRRELQSFHLDGGLARHLSVIAASARVRIEILAQTPIVFRQVHLWRLKLLLANHPK